MRIVVYVVWSLEDTDNVDIFLDPNKAEELMQEYGEFGMMSSKEFSV